jgi:cytochrome c551
MKRPKIAVVAGLAALAAFACSSKPGGTALSGEQLAAARNLYSAQGCTLCHGQNGEGGIGATLRAGQVATHPVERLAEQITNGGNGMPAFKDKLKPEEITLLARFIKQEFQGQ